MIDYTIIVDTREQKPLWKEEISDKVKRKTLKVGDYSIEGYESKIVVERKSLSDLFGTLGSGHKRFKAELQRALKYDYFAIVIDGSYTSCINKDFEGSHYSKMKGVTITSILFTLHLKYGVNFFFTNGRVESKKLIKELFNAYVKLYT